MPLLESTFNLVIIHTDTSDCFVKCRCNSVVTTTDLLFVIQLHIEGSGADGFEHLKQRILDSDIGIAFNEKFRIIEGKLQGLIRVYITRLT